MEAADAAGMTASVRAGKRVALDTVGLFADGAAVRCLLRPARLLATGAAAARAQSVTAADRLLAPLRREGSVIAACAG